MKLGAASQLGAAALDEVEELDRLSGRAFATMVAEAPGLEVRLSGSCALGLSGEDVADLNMLFLGVGAESGRFLAEAMARVDALGLPVVALMAPGATAALAPAAERLGLDGAGTMPLMVLRASTHFNLGRACRIEPALDVATVRASGDLVAAAFELPRGAVARTLDASLTPTAGFATFVAYSEATPMSSVAVTRTGSTAGIWCMATPPEHQGKGMGRGLLTRVLDRLRREGVERFYLHATDAGRPLYESIGFETIADQAVWVKGRSTQAHA
jgi:GNAT superfamily N-acetyltransferase